MSRSTERTARGDAKSAAERVVLTERVLAAVRHVKEAVLVLVLVVHLRARAADGERCARRRRARRAATVVRGGAETVVAVAGLAVGDVLLLRAPSAAAAAAGDGGEDGGGAAAVVPADCRILAASADFSVYDGFFGRDADGAADAADAAAVSYTHLTLPTNREV